MPAAEALRLESLVDYQEGAVVSRTLSRGPAGTLTLFAFAAGQELSEHSAPFDAYVMVLEGRVELTIGGRPVAAEAGQTVRLPARVPHALHAPGQMKMLLMMWRAGE